MPNRKNIHITRRSSGDWAAKREGASRAGSVHRTQREAIDAARRTAIRERGEVVIHGEDHKIRDRDSYGNDPFPPRDRRH